MTEKYIYRLYPATFVARLFCLGLSAAAESPRTEDIAKFCKNMKPVTNAMMDRLEEHESELSGACRAYEAKMAGSRVEIEEAVREKKRFLQTCQNDIARFSRKSTADRAGSQSA